LHELGISAALYHPRYSLNILGAADILYLREHSGGYKVRCSYGERAFQRFSAFISELASLLIRHHSVCPVRLRIISRNDPELAVALSEFKNIELISKDRSGKLCLCMWHWI